MIGEFPLWKSRKFWLMILDLVISLVLFFGAKYLMPNTFDDVKFLVAAIQPVFAFLIASIAYEDGQAMRAGLVE
jgi:hypothetical protein